MQPEHYCAQRTHCPRGHAYTPENTYIVKGHYRRRCRACKRAKQKAREKAKRAAMGRTRVRLTPEERRARERAREKAWRDRNPEKARERARRQEEHRRLRALPGRLERQRLRVEAREQRRLAREADKTARPPKPLPTACPKGHPYAGENIRSVRRSDGRTWRTCVACRRVRDARKPPLTPEQRERQRAQGRVRYRANREIETIQRRAHYKANRAATIAKVREWQRANPEKHRAIGRRRWARLRGAAVCDLTAAQWRAITAHYGHRCVYCGKKPKRLTQDHIVAVSRGGMHTASNVVPACSTCNSRKAAGPPPVPVQPMLLV